jgi:hydroxyacylglutathione hydrolase
MPKEMFLETIQSPGISHLSYIFGHQGQAAVIDPRRDCDIYQQIALEHQARITHIFETHRNEDYVIGSTELQRRTGAEIHHGAALEFQYGLPVRAGDTFRIGNFLLRVLETPGHTFESISIAVYDQDYDEKRPILVFTGDALFIGDVGRTDFFPDRKEEVAGLLYDSIFSTLLPLGDDVILCPAHGAGSVCGHGMAAREFSTLGYERRNNPVLQYTDRDEFIRYKVSESHERPPYFKKMEEFNQNGDVPSMPAVPQPPSMTVEQFAERMEQDLQAVDVRSPEAFGGCHVPGTLCIPLNMLPAYAGWFLDHDRPIGLILESSADLPEAMRHLIRLGYDRVEGYLGSGLTAWESAGRAFRTVPAVHVCELAERIDNGEDLVILDVRSASEVREQSIEHAIAIPLGELPNRLEEIPRDTPLATFCGSGRRAMIAASILQRNGFQNVSDALGSLAAVMSISCKELLPTGD